MKLVNNSEIGFSHLLLVNIKHKLVYLILLVCFLSGCSFLSYKNTDIALQNIDSKEPASLELNYEFKTEVINYKSSDSSYIRTDNPNWNYAKDKIINYLNYSLNLKKFLLKNNIDIQKSTIKLNLVKTNQIFTCGQLKLLCPFAAFVPMKFKGEFKLKLSIYEKEKIIYHTEEYIDYDEYSMILFFPVAIYQSLTQKEEEAFIYLAKVALNNLQC